MNRFTRRLAIALTYALLSGLALPGEGDPNEFDIVGAVARGEPLSPSPDPPLSGAAAENAGIGTCDPNQVRDAEALIDTLLTDDLLDPNNLPGHEPAVEPGPEEIPFPQAVPPALYPEGTDRLYRRTWTTEVFGAVAFGDSAGELYTMHLSFERVVWGRLNWALQPFGGLGVGEEDTAGIYGFDSIWKYPVFSTAGAKVNIEGGGGVQESGPKSWPDNGSHFNWRPQLGVGVKVDTGRDQNLLFGGRWLHVAGMDSREDNNVDELMLYAGFQLRF